MAYRFIGTASDDRSGSRVTSGDFDRDGIADYAIGAYGTGNAGVVYLIAGSDLQALDLANGPSADGIIDLSDVADAAGSYVISGEYAGGGFGVRGGLVLADADGDGRDDVLVGAVLSDMESGAAYLIDSQNLADFASNGAFNISELTSDRAAFADSYRFLGQNPGDRAGQSIDVVGDLTGDDVQDIAIGSYWADPNGVVEAGELAILSGAEFAAADGNNDGTIVLGTNIANQADSYLIEGTIDHGKVGVSVAPGGDPDGNGHDAVLVGEPQLDNSQTVPGTGYAIDGADLASLAGADGILSIADVPTGANSHGFEGATDGDQTGFQMLSIGDIDGDGLAETLVGAPNADAGAADTGTIYIVSSKDWPAGGVPLDLGDPASLQNSWVIEGEANNAIGTGIGDIGDITGGSEAELLIRAFDTTDSTAPGASYLLSLDDLLAVAPTGGTVQIGDIVTDRGDWANSYRIVGADPGDRAGTVNAGVADMFGASGKAGLMIGAPGTGSAAGTTYILGEADLLRHGTDGEVDLGEVLLCFARGTRIAVPGGSRAVEALRPGDLVETLDRGPQPVVWTGPMVEAARGRRAPCGDPRGRAGAGRAHPRPVAEPAASGDAVGQGGGADVRL
jgi:hypothetical protein